MKNNQKISFPTLLSLVIGSVIGIGIFFKSGKILENSGGDAGLAITGWVLGGIISLCAALTVAEIGSQLKDTGGLSSMMRIGGEVISKPFGRILSFLTGWFQVFYMGALIASLCYYFPMFFFTAIGKDSLSVNPMLYVLMGFITLFIAFGTNVLSAQFGGWVAKLSVVIKVIPLILIVLFGVMAIILGNTQAPVSLLPSNGDHIVGGVSKSIPMILGVILPAVLFSYDGWLFATTVAEDVENPGKNVPLAIIGGILFVTIIYVLANIGVIVSGQKDVPSALSYFLNQDPTKINFVSQITNIIIAISAYGVINGYGIISQRFVYGLAENNNFFAPKIFSKKIKNGFPLISGIVMGAVVSIYLLIQYFVPLTATVINGEAISTVTFYGQQADYLSDMITVEMWILYTLLFVLVLSNRLKNKSTNQTFKLPIGVLVTCVTIAVTGAAFFIYQNIISALSAKPEANATVLGIPTFALQFIVLMTVGTIVYYTTGIYKTSEKKI